MKTPRLVVLLLFATGFSLSAEDKVAEKLKPALDVITPDALLAHIKTLASDEFEGRSPGTKGEELSIKYISDQFRSIGLKPGNPNGSYFQEVSLAGIKSNPKRVEERSQGSAGRQKQFAWSSDDVAFLRRVDDEEQNPARRSSPLHKNARSARIPRLRNVSHRAKLRVAKHRDRRPVAETGTARVVCTDGQVPA